MIVIELFRLFGSIFIDDKDAGKSLDTIDNKAEKTGSRLGGMIGTAAKVGAGIAAGMGVAAGAIMGLATKTASSADRIDKESQKIGLSRQAFQEWDFVLSQSGASIDSMGAGIKSMTALLEDANQGGDKSAEVFARLGLSLDDVTNMSREEAFEAMVTALQGVEDETEKATLANLAFGRSGQEMMPLLNGAAGSIDEMKNKANDLGLVMGDEAVDSGVEFTDTMDQLKRTIGATLSQALAPLLPILNDLMQQFITLIPPLMNFIQPLAEKLIPVIQRIIEALLPVFIRLLDAFMPILDPLIDLFLMLVDEVFIPLIDLLLPIIEMLMPVFIQLLMSLIPILIPLINIFMQIINLILPLFIKYFEFITSKVLPLFIRVIEKIAPVLEKFASKFTDIFDKLRNGFKSVVNFIIRGVNTLIRGMNKISFDIPDWVPGVGGKGFGINISEIPSLDVGTNHVPQDMLAFLHEGEAVVPKEYNNKSGVTVQIIEPHLFNDRDADKLGNMIVKRLKGLGVNPA